MTQMVFPFAPVLLLLVVGFLVTFKGLLLLSRNRESLTVPPSRERMSLGAIAVVIGLSTTSGALYWGVSWVLFQQDLDSRFTFTYSARLEFNGSGIVRVSLPIPSEERLLGEIRVTGPSSTFAYNRSGAESALDVEFSGPTVVSAEFRGRTPPDRFEAPDLTRNNRSVSTFSFEQLAGGVMSVHVEFRASWIRTCFTQSWSQDVWIAPGLADHPGRWSVLVC